MSGRRSIAELESATWLAEPEHVSALLDQLRAHVAGISAGDMKTLQEMRASMFGEPPPPYVVRDGVAHVRVAGDLFDEVPWIVDAVGIRATGYVDLRASLRAAADDPEVASILLEIDSPGGMVTGLAGLADEIYSMRDVKPIHAHATGDAASAAYWLGSQTSRFTAEATSRVGSIGVLALVPDTSRRADMQGVRMHAVRSGPQKGAPAPGMPVTHEALAPLQENVDALAGVFRAAVSRGRGVDAERVASWSSGRTWAAGQAEALGLIDGVGSLDAAHAAAVERGGGQRISIAREGGHTQPAAHAAKVQEDSMSEKDVSALAERLAALEARDKEKEQKLSELGARNAELEAVAKQAQAAADLRAASVAGIVAGLKTRAIEAGIKQGRITAQNKALVESFAAACGDDVAKLEAEIAKQPVQIAPTALGQTGEQLAGGAASKLSADDLAVARALGLSESQMVAAETVSSISMDRTVRTKDGLRRELKEVLA